MARPHHPYDRHSHGDLAVETSPDNDCVDVYYIPSPEQLEQSTLESNSTEEHRVKILELDNDSQQVTIFPINTFGDREDFLEPKYSKIQRITIAGATPVISELRDDAAGPSYSRSITFGPTVPIQQNIDEKDIEDTPTTKDDVMEILESLPPAFTKDYDYGLGLAKPYRFIIDTIEKICDCTELLISADRCTGIDDTGTVFCISHGDFETLRKSMNNATTHGRAATNSVKATLVQNFFAEKLGTERIPLRIGRHPLRRMLTEFVQSEGKTLSTQEQDDVLDVMTANITAISEKKPERLTRLRSDIEIVNPRDPDNAIRRHDKRRTPRGRVAAVLQQEPVCLKHGFWIPDHCGSRTSYGRRSDTFGEGRQFY